MKSFELLEIKSPKANKVNNKFLKKTRFKKLNSTIERFHLTSFNIKRNDLKEKNEKRFSKIIENNYLQLNEDTLNKECNFMDSANKIILDQKLTLKNIVERIKNEIKDNPIDLEDQSCDSASINSEELTYNGSRKSK